MPATFAHCLMVQEAIDKIPKKIKLDDPLKGEKMKYAGKIGEQDNFVIMGAAGPDYPYLTDILTTSVLQISHTWANRMHYENTLLFVKEGVKRLAAMDRNQESFFIKIAWFCGFVSHVVADSFMHPVINSIVHGIYLFTHQEHARCELIQDVYIFKKMIDEDIISSNPREGKFGYLKILEECSDPDDKDKNRIHPEICNFWRELLMAAHPDAQAYFNDIIPDRWHYNYKKTVDFIADPGAIFRHVMNMAGREYMKASDIPPQERTKYITDIEIPYKGKSNYDSEFQKAVDLIVDVWLKIIEDIEGNTPDNVAGYIKDWNLDTGVDQSQIYLWMKEGA